MKKLLLVGIIALTGAMTANAQTDKGTWMLGGSAAFQATKGSNDFYLSPNAGYFIADNFAVGGQLDLYLAKSYNAWGIGPFARAYFAGSEKGKFFGQAGVNIGGAKNADTEVGFGIGAGYAFFLNESVALEIGPRYTKTGKQNGIFVLGAGFQIHFKK